jgi:hypothetical protein
LPKILYWFDNCNRVVVHVKVYAYSTKFPCIPPLLVGHWEYKQNGIKLPKYYHGQIDNRICVDIIYIFIIYKIDEFIELVLELFLFEKSATLGKFNIPPNTKPRASVAKIRMGKYFRLFFHVKTPFYSSNTGICSSTPAFIKN